MASKNTKQDILDEALALFAVRGYDGVSVKDIAGAVGIKDSSLYKHYASKQEIFDTLIKEMDEKFEQIVARYQLPQGAIEKVARQYGENDLSWLKTAVRAIFVFFLKDEYAVKFRHMLMIEQFKNNKAANTFRNWFIDSALGFQTNLFRQMMKYGYFTNGDPYTVALQFYGPLFLLLIIYDAKPNKADEALDLLDKHVEQFASLYENHEKESK